MRHCRNHRVKICAFKATLASFILALVVFGAGILPASALAKDPPFKLPQPQELGRIKSAIIYTNRGNLYFDLFPELAPWHVANFKYLADKGFYHNLRFHLFIPNYIIQGGASDPSKPDSGPGYSLPAEFSDEKHVPGTLGMARKIDFLNPERRSHGSQFHILLTDAPPMNGRYTIFGRLVSGMKVLESLRKGDIIQDIKVFVRPGARQAPETPAAIEPTDPGSQGKSSASAPPPGTYSARSPS